MSRDSAPQKLDESMFPTLPKHGTRVARVAATPRRPSQMAPAKQTSGTAQPGPPVLCDMCGNRSVRPKCGRCWGVVSGLASLRRESPPAYDAFVATIR